MKTTFISTALLCILATTACSREPDPAAQVPQDVREAVQNAPSAPAPPTARTVDVCALLAESDAIAVLGPLFKPPEALTLDSGSSLLGQCLYFGAKGNGSVSAQPAGLFKGTIEYLGKDKPVSALAGLGEAAYATDPGVYVQPAGKPYFLLVSVTDNGGPNLSEALARKLKL